MRIYPRVLHPIGPSSPSSVLTGGRVRAGTSSLRAWSSITAARQDQRLTRREPSTTAPSPSRAARWTCPSSLRRTSPPRCEPKSQSTMLTRGYVTYCISIV
eukprot:729407-Prorocentrum_minimum.AAC.1